MVGLIFVVLAIGGVLVAVVAVAVALVVMRGRRGGGGRAFAEPRMSPEASWQAAGASLSELGMRMLDAECATMSFPEGGTLYVKAEIREGALLAWVERACPGGSMEQFLGARAELGPGDRGRSALAQFVASAVAEPLGALPRRARLKVKAPEMPGDEYKLELTSPMSSPRHPSLVARTLIALDAAARKPIPAGAHVQTNLPPAATHWMAAAPALQALGMRQLDAECYVHNFTDGIGTLYLKVEVREGTMRGWTERACPGGGLEQFLNQRTELKPGAHGSGPLGQMIASTVGQALGALPRGALLQVRTPEIPGADYHLDLTAPLGAPDHPALAARVLLALDAAVRRPAPAGAHPQGNLPPAAAHWMASASGFATLGMHALEAECYVRNFPEGGTLYVRFDLRDASVRGWIDRAFHGGALERFLGGKVELHPGDAPRSKLGQGVLGAVQPIFATLPRSATLTVKAPEIQGAEYQLALTCPITSPEHGPLVARVLLALDAAVRVSH